MRFAFLRVALGLVASAAISWAGEPRGLVIYKERAFQADRSAVLMEYRSQTTHGSVTYFLTLQGRRVTVPTGKAEAIFLPYPGTGQATPEEALTILASARRRFPQFVHHYRLYEHAWKAEAQRPKAEITREVATREAQEAHAQGFTQWLRTQPPSRPTPTPPANLLKPSPTPPVPESTEAATERSVTEQLQTIRQLYQELE